MTQLTGTGPQVVAQGLFEESSTALHNLGEIVHSNDGRAYRYAKAGGSALVAGNVQQGSAEDTGDQDLTPAATAIGSTSIVFTSTVTVTENQYAGGFVSITTSAGVGYVYPISGHAAFTAAAPTINLGQAIDVALTTSSRVDLVKNPYDAVILHAGASPTAVTVGVAVTAMTAAYFGWLQVLGPATVESEGGSSVGVLQIASDGDAGCVEDIGDGANELDVRIGVAMTGIADGEFGLVRLSIG